MLFSQVQVEDNISAVEFSVSLAAATLGSSLGRLGLVVDFFSLRGSTLPAVATLVSVLGVGVLEEEGQTGAKPPENSNDEDVKAEDETGALDALPQFLLDLEQALREVLTESRLQFQPSEPPKTVPDGARDAADEFYRNLSAGMHQLHDDGREPVSMAAPPPQQPAVARKTSEFSGLDATQISSAQAAPVSVPAAAPSTTQDGEESLAIPRILTRQIPHSRRPPLLLFLLPWFMTLRAPCTTQRSARPTLASHRRSLRMRDRRSRPGRAL